MNEPPPHQVGDFLLMADPLQQGGEQYTSYSIVRITTVDPEAHENGEQVCWCPTKEDAQLILAALQLAQEIEPFRGALPVKLRPWPPKQEMTDASV